MRRDEPALAKIRAEYQKRFGKPLPEGR